MVDWSQAFKTLNRAAKLRQIKTLGQDQSLTIEDDVESLAQLFEKGLRSKPDEPKGVVIPKTCIALYSEEHAQLPFALKTVNVLDGTVVKEVRATHICPPDDRHAYMEMYPDAVVLGVCVRNGIPT